MPAKKILKDATNNGLRSGSKKLPKRAVSNGNLNFDMLHADSMVKTQVSDSKLVGERRSQLVLTAIELFSRKGYHATTVKEIADLARVSPGLVYQYFEDKEDILFLSLQVVVHSINRVIPPAIDGVEHPVTKFAVAFIEYCNIVDKNRQAVELTYRETKSLNSEYRNALKGMETTTNSIIKVCLDECVRRKYMRDVNMEIFVYQVILAAQTWALKHWRLSSMTTAQEYTRTQLDFLLNAVLTKSGWNSYLNDVAVHPHAQLG